MNKTISLDWWFSFELYYYLILSRANNAIFGSKILLCTLWGLALAKISYSSHAEVSKLCYLLSLNKLFTALEMNNFWYVNFCAYLLKNEMNWRKRLVYKQSEWAKQEMEGILFADECRIAAPKMKVSVSLESNKPFLHEKPSGNKNKFHVFNLVQIPYEERKLT